ncbi:winged helix-turn-helix domain-containing protein [Aeromonas sp. XH]|uniref:winged helix-turn-helix domain-containing protein n=1 Tax=Aeromonas sp. XH TaxID=3081770 RepID=UPI002966B182|nr:winged helix-turn-helix domain-containing protein [Aeromonas sp. XH]WOX47328.1 winged helix-turn-helix domain-containing protein [Aeromonas sp. XH]
MNMHSLILDIHSGDIILDGQKVARLSVSETCVLALLASNEGRLLSKEQLLDEGWPGKVVSPSSLTVAIKNIRKALCAKDTPTYIETVHRKGYIYHGEGAKFSIKEKDTLSNESKGIDIQSPEDNGGSMAVAQAAINPEINQELYASEYSLKKSECSLKHRRVPGKPRIHYGRIIGWGAFSIVYIFFLCLAIFVFLSKKDLVCYQVEQATVCGRFKLDDAAINEIKSKLNDKTGDYLYGYTKNLDGIEIYQRH